MARQLGGTDDEHLDVVVIGGSQAGFRTVVAARSR